MSSASTASSAHASHRRRTLLSRIYLALIERPAQIHGPRDAPQAREQVVLRHLRTRGVEKEAILKPARSSASAPLASKQAFSRCRRFRACPPARGRVRAFASRGGSFEFSTRTDNRETAV
ncbi:hypothetical protein FB451DRAFT_1411570 [Mycena latifolia]|nr:hypothetical protein FB451DRAFT_1411570 [Mycena latifolia]